MSSIRDRARPAGAPVGEGIIYERKQEGKRDANGIPSPEVNEQWLKSCEWLPSAFEPM